MQSDKVEASWHLVSVLSKASPVPTSFLKLKCSRRKSSGGSVGPLVKLLQFIVQKTANSAFEKLRLKHRELDFDIDAELIANQSRVLQTLETRLFAVSSEAHQLKKMNACWNLLGSFERRLSSIWKSWAKILEAQNELIEYLRVLEAKLQHENMEDESTISEFKERLDRNSFSVQ
mmetsp:Transcript_11900/g.22843  ORF Transcript_11900/g.22843 Transcript_11900/m.22843 type:complete len:175 (-) Transcript_11900:1689-2213(-)